MVEKSDLNVLIVGGSGGIGAAISRAFAKKGAALSLASIDQEGLSKVAEECKSLGAKSVVQIVADLTNMEGMERIVKETMESFENLNVFVNSAGSFYVGNTESTTFDDYNKMFNINLRAPFFMTQLCIPYLEKTKGNIVHISSLCSKCYMPHLIAYNMTKAGLDHFTKTSALELSAKGIRVNAVNPSAVLTGLWNNCKLEVGIDEFFEEFASKQPLGRKNIDAEDIADSVLFLSSDAAKMITGVCLNIDCGRGLVGQ